MGQDLYAVKYEDISVKRNYAFFEWLMNTFKTSDFGEQLISIELYEFEKKVNEEGKKFKADYKEEIKGIVDYLKTKSYNESDFVVL